MQNKDNLIYKNFILDFSPTEIDFSLLGLGMNLYYLIMSVRCPNKNFPQVLIYWYIQNCNMKQILLDFINQREYVE